MSARKLAALVIKLVFLYLAVTSFFNMLMVLVSLPFAEGLELERVRYLNVIAALACTFIFFGCLVYGDRLARWIVREDWTIASEEADGSVFWSKTVPLLMVMGTGILVIGESASSIVGKLAAWIVIAESESFIYPMPSQILGELLSLAVGAYLFLRPGSLLKLFHRFGKME